MMFTSPAWGKGYELCVRLFAQVASYLLATGTAAGFAVTKDIQRLSDESSLEFDKFFDKAYASAGMLLLGFICVALLSIAASFNLPKMA